MQTLSDLIFGLALSIGAITLLSSAPGHLSDVASTLLGYGWAFVILALVWVRYTKIMSVLPVETNVMIGANMFLLFLVSIEPYLYNLLSGSYFSTASQLTPAATTSLYALDMGAIFAVLTYFSHELTREERKLIPKHLLRSYRLQTYGSLAAVALFWVSILPTFWEITVFGIEARFVLWMGTFVIAIIRTRIDARSKKAPEQGVSASAGEAHPPEGPTRLSP